MATEIEIDSARSRIRAALVNSGRYGFEEAENKLASSRLLIRVADEASRTPAGQAAVLTATATAVRCYGHVQVGGSVKAQLRLPLSVGADTLEEAVSILGGDTGDTGAPDRVILIGSGLKSSGTWCVQAFWDGWTVGFAPGCNQMHTGCSSSAVAGVAAGALAVGQAFLAEQGNPSAGKTVQVLSLWRPAGGQDMVAEPDFGQCCIPKSLWLIGLGNLGQAFIWTLSMVPCSSGRAVLYLQDDDLVQEENWGTSLLVKHGQYGMLKTRLAEQWAEEHGFRVRRIDRRLDKHQRRTDHEPGIVLAGLDRMPARRLLGLPGFEYVIDAGLGATAADYHKFRINVFDRRTDPAQHFAGVEDTTEQEITRLLRLPAYESVAAHSANGKCGAAMLAERSVAVPFVSAFVGALVIAQAIRIASGFGAHRALTGSINDLRGIRGTLAPKPKRIGIETMEVDPVIASLG